VHDPQQNIVLTGFMGTGKTTVGRELARKLGMDFVDTDELIEDRHGPISRIFAERGEAEFRAIEQGVAREVGEQTGLVIATGGRMLLDPESYESMSSNGRIFCLVASPEEIHRRVDTDESRKERPLLHAQDQRQRIVELMAEREEGYARFEQLDTDDATPGEVADEIVRRLGTGGG
jgi:shikimate kinase